MKKYLCHAAAALILALAGCAVQKTGVRPYLPESGLYYSCVSYAEPVKRLQEIAEQLDMSLRKSTMPDLRKRQIGAMLAAFRLALLKSGFADNLESGVSSRRLPDGEPGFLTTRVLASADRDAAGLLWRAFGRQERDIRAELAALPADTIAAFAVELRTEDIAAQTAEILELFAGVPLPGGRIRIARALAGRWVLVCRPGTDRIAVELTIPDREQALGSLLKTFFPARADGAIHLPRLGDGVEPVVFSASGQLKLRLGTPAPVPADDLASRPELQNRLRHLPETGAGWAYLAPGWGRHLGADAIAPADELPHLFAVLTAKPNALILRSVSSWDPVSEEWLLPIVLFGTEPFARAIISGEQMRDAAQERRAFSACGRQLAAIGKGLREYAARHGGKFPAAHDIEGFRELLKDGILAPDKLVCPAAHGDTPARDAASFTCDNCSYVYVGGSGPETPGDFPLVFDWPLNHRGRFHVLTVGGKIAEFRLDRLDSCRKLVSFLQSRFRYPEPDFRRLLEVADKLDAKFLRGHSK